MTVAQILSRKGRAVVTAAPAETMQGVVNLLTQNRIGAVIVLDSKGAELLLGQGDMLFLNPKTSEIRRAQATSSAVGASAGASSR